jgi:two-component sensor histidine kinase
MISVSDNGIGMPQDFDLDEVTTLGLTLIRRLTRQLKGTLSLFSQDGTTIRIEFPAGESG